MNLWYGLVAAHRGKEMAARPVVGVYETEIVAFSEFMEHCLSVYPIASGFGSHKCDVNIVPQVFSFDGRRYFTQPIEIPDKDEPFEIRHTLYYEVREER